MRFTDMLVEYRRDVTAQKLGDKLLASAKRENITDVDQILAALEDMDPTPNKQYTLWIANQYNKGQFRLEDKPRIKTALERFTQAKSRLQEKDIGKYDFYRLEDEMEKIFNPEVGKPEPQTTDTFEIPAEIKDEVEVLYNGPLGLLVIPKTEKASCVLGSGTRWCTAGQKDNQFSYYNKEGPLYIWRDKNGKKFQFHFGKEDFQFMDSKDRPISKEQLDYFRTEHPIIKKLFDRIVKNLIDNKKALTLVNYAIFLKERIPEAEAAISKNAEAAVTYANKILVRTWPEAEKTIRKSPKAIVRYARTVAYSSWPEAEHIILKDPAAAVDYARHIIRDTWPKAERIIAKSPMNAVDYAQSFFWKKGWLVAEPYIKKNAEAAVKYANNVLNKRWKEAEPVIAKSPADAFEYARDVIGGRFKLAEPYIMKDPESAADYSIHVLKKRWPAAEKYIKKNKSWWDFYLEAFNSPYLKEDDLTEAKTKTSKKSKGDCFIVAAKAMIAPFSPELKLVHALVNGQGPLSGKRFSHAWNEIGDVVIDLSNGRKIVMRKDDYYRIGNINQAPGEYAMYDHLAAKKKMIEHQTYGPWELDDSKEKLDEVIIDNRSGLAATPLNGNVDYLGLRVMMQPSVFLKLSVPMAEDEDYEYIKNHIKNQGSIGAPFLQILLPDEYHGEKDLTRVPKVIGHEGRHRMAAIKQIEGDAPVETHLLFHGRNSEFRRRHLTDAIIQKINDAMRNQSGDILFGPFFTLKK